MGIAVTGDETAFAEAVAAFAARHAPAERIRAVVNGTPGDVVAGLWVRLVDQGFLELYLPEPDGAGATLVDVAVLVEQAGRRLLPGPLLPTLLAGFVVHRAADGDAEARAALPTSAPAAAALSPTGLVARRTADGWTVDGRTGPVLGAPGAEHLLLAAAGDGEDVWFVVPAAEVTVHAEPGLDGTRALGTVECSGLAVQAGLRVPVSTAQVRAVAATLFAAEAAGIARWCEETGTAYAKIREQFGRPIGAFQAVKHKCARTFVAGELMAAAAWDAATAFGQGDDQFGHAAAVAATQCLQRAVDLCLDTVTLLGAIGNTWEHDAHLYWRRAMTLRALFGPTARTAGEVARSARSVHRSRSLELGAEPAGLRERVAAVLQGVVAAPAGQRQALLAEAGLVAPQYPAPHGLDAGPVEQIVIAQEFQRAGLPQPSMVIGEWALPTIIVHGDDAQRERFVRPSLRGEITWCQLFSEPGAGSDLASLRMRADRVDGGWRLAGQKIWSSNAHTADWGICLARTDPAAAKHHGITYFLVDMRSPGLTVRQIREANGRAEFNETFFDDVFVPDACVIGDPGEGWRLARTTLGNERLSIGGGHGSRRLPVDIAAAYGAAGPDLEQRAGELTADYDSLDAMGQRILVRSLDALEPGPEGAVLKLLHSQLAPRVAEFELACAGDAGALDGGAATALLSAPRVLIGGGTVEMQLNMIGERILGLPRS
ncbi:acyl-CoA dehydrogenase family protein [Trujillonella endophytica]|uniref:Acyl-CoA dehydrogenase n=1 Tax=Trujillonella endophytica TaxID=673521 RepID=A0A1H8VW65_9ACTN|nr:acyl-CoA dehydrogenase family protein [Trujillella endophytica]SEP19477.1 Acyl-CoA dehydrogenase [Trujillella endophytica]